MRSALFVTLAVVLGCSSDPPVKWPELHPVKGLVKVGGKAVSGGSLHFRAEDAALTDFIVISDVEADGTFTLATRHVRDKTLELKPGAPAGKYTATFSTPQGDQTAGKSAIPIQGTKLVTIVAGENNLTLELSKK
jgi:hypothetical protein